GEFHRSETPNPPRRNSHRSGITEFHAQGYSIARKLQSLTRWGVPPLGNYRISRAGVVHRSGMAKSHALGSSTARKTQNLTRWGAPSLVNLAVLRTWDFYR